MEQQLLLRKCTSKCNNQRRGATHNRGSEVSSDPVARKGYAGEELGRDWEGLGGTGRAGGRGWLAAIADIHDAMDVCMWIGS